MARVGSARRKKYIDEDNARRVEKAKIKKIIIQNADNMIKFNDKKYFSIVSALKKELIKRNIDISDDNFDERLDEIISSVLELPGIGKRFAGSPVKDIRNAVKRSIRQAKNYQEKER